MQKIFFVGFCLALASAVPIFIEDQEGQQYYLEPVETHRERREVKPLKLNWEPKPPEPGKLTGQGGANSHQGGGSVQYEHPNGSDYPEPCDKTYCAWGAQCVNAADGRAICQCPTSCKPKVEKVCGTDGKTYDNYCLLRVASCKARLNTRVKHNGECVQTDLCRDMVCGFGARCALSADGRNASCVCPDACPSYGDHVSSHPVCGSDGVDYKNKCELDRAACRSVVNITVKFNGKCDPCSGVSCAEPEICQLDEQRNPVCRCGDTCPLEFSAVCGSDGKTYSNECTLRQEACRTRKTLNIIYRGKCSSGINPCATARCTFGQECSINKQGIAECLCPPRCEPIMRPVCSKDGRTFASECELRRTACLARASIEVAYAGVCGERGPCSEHVCRYGAACVERAGAAHCDCPACSSEFEPVCGSDGISYGNVCKLRLEACKHRREISVLYDGPCNGCENKKCEFYSVCESEGANEGRCVCPSTCTDSKLINGTVCGTDGGTYANECELRQTACQAKLLVSVAYKGNCDLCEGVQCKYGARCEAGECVCPENCADAGDESVCASNMITYKNECELQMAQCAQPAGATPLAVVFYGDCREKFPVAGAFTTTLSPAVASIIPAFGFPVAPDSSNVIEGSTATKDAKEACRDIHCDYKATCELGPDNYPRCTCRFDCAGAALASPGPAKPVCSSDMRVYPSLCHMNMEACQRQEDLRLRPMELCEGMEVKPCKGEKPLTDPITNRELDCGSGPFRQDCPSNSYCHQTATFARCCRKDQNYIEKKTCEDNLYGCCPDGKTPAQGHNQAGCPIHCGCHKLGSYSEYCDVKTKKCKCRPGVGGDRCDRCEPGFWGLPKISTGIKGCMPCGCSVFGSVRDDCEQMTGRCVCKTGVKGQKCTICTSHNKVLGPNGCVPADLSTAPPSTCKELTCHFGATCVEQSGFAVCECHIQCPRDTEDQPVCGNDGKTYRSQCELTETACRLQKDIVIEDFGKCREEVFPATDWPSRRYTPLQFTQPDETNPPLSKSTRHLLIPDIRLYYGSGTATRPHSGETTGENNISTVIQDINLKRGEEDNSLVSRPTSATIHVSPLLGDICSRSLDCQITNSYCVADACKCLPDFNPSEDRQSCIAIIENRACASDPCLHSGTCIDLPGETFTCICPENYTGISCEHGNQRKLYETPAFNGRSYALLRTIDVYNKLTMEIDIVPYSLNGILMYNAEIGNGNGDYISLAIVGGYVEFKYNLGHGAVVMRTQEQVELGRQHKVVAKRYNRDGMLKLDDGDEILAKAQGTMKALDLKEVTYIGYVPSNYTAIYDRIGTDEGFQGCIKKFKMGRDVIELHVGSNDMVVETKNIFDCSQHACTASPCENGGVCVPHNYNFTCQCPEDFGGTFCHRKGDICRSNPCPFGSKCRSFDNRTFLCICRPGRNGKRCEVEYTKDVPIIAEFRGRNFIEYPSMGDASNVTGPPAFSIDVSFMPKASNGLILFSGQVKNDDSNSVSLVLSGGRVIFQFRCNENVFSLVLLDGLKHILDVHGGFRGFIKNISLNGLSFPFTNADCDEDNDDNICSSMGEASHMDQEEKWLAKACNRGRVPQKYRQLFCPDGSPAIKFTGDMYMRYRQAFNKRRRSEQANRYKIKLQTFVSDALVLWRSKSRKVSKEYFAIAIVDGVPELSYNLGRERMYWAIRSKKRIDDGLWHTIQVRRKKRIGFISVDGEKPVRGRSMPGAKSLSTDSKIWIGGARSLPPGLPAAYSKGFYGCVKHIYVHDKPLDLFSNIDGKKVNFCHDNDI